MRQPHRPPAPRTVLRVERLEDRSTPAAVAPDRVLVTLADPAAAFSAPLRVPLAGPFAEAVTPIGFGVYRVELPAGTDVAAAVGFYAAQPDVAAAAPDRIVRLDRAAPDPGAAENWGFDRIGAPAAWDRQTGTRETVVAVIDSGIDLAHPDLKANLWVNPRETPGNGRDDDGNGFTDDVHGADFPADTGDPRDDDGHGTHIAGIIGAVGGNGVGIAGVTWNTRLMALKFLTADGTGYTSDAVRALNYAVANGAKVVNLSWGGPDFDAALSAAIGRARDAGVVVVAAAGNDGRDTDPAPFYPAGYAPRFDNVVTVAAADRDDRLAGFSNFGRTTVTLAAPGVSVNSTLPNNRYAPLSGTSVAAPFVAGAVALLWDQNPTWTYRQVIDRLTESVDPLPSLAGKTTTGGRLNLARMFGAAAPPVVPPAVHPPPAADGPRVTTAYFAGAAARTFDKARVTFNSPIDPATFTPADVAVAGPAGAIAATGVTPVAGSANTRFDVAFATQTRPGAYTITIGPDVRDPAGTRMDQDGDGQPGESADDRFSVTATLAGPPTPPTEVPPTVPPAPPPAVPPTPAPTPAGRVTFASVGGPVAIPDRGTAAVAVQVDRDLTVADLDVRLDLAHTYVSDLVIRLTSPGGQTVTLVNRRGGSGDDFAGTVFDDAADRVLVTGRAPFRGAFQPEEVLAAFHGANARGTWTLTVEDRSGKDVGRVTGVALDIAGAATAQRVVAVEVGRSIAFWEDGRTDAVVVPVPPPPLRSQTRALLGWEEPPHNPPDDRPRRP